MTGRSIFCFRSKRLIPFVSTIHELPPGNKYLEGEVHPDNILKPPHAINLPAEKHAGFLRKVLEETISSLCQPEYGSWLSGGLDLSAITAIASQYIPKMHTFVAGLAGAPDLEFARAVANHLGTIHHEVTVDLKKMLAVLPDVNLPSRII